MQITEQNKRIIALDLDGTVLYHDSTFDPALGAAIRRLHEIGHEVIISTGRAVDSTLPIVEELGIRPTWVIASNGAVTLRRDPLVDRGYRRQHVETFDPTEVLKRIRGHLLTARYGVETATGDFLYTEKIPASTLPMRQKLVPFEELFGIEATRVLVVSPDHALEDFLRIVDTMGLNRVSYSVGWTAWLDIAPEGVSKESALEVLRSRLEIPRSRIFAAGDGSNDIEMLRWAGRHGEAIAMGQGPEHVRAVATKVTGSVDDGGLLTALVESFPAELAEFARA